MAGAPGGSQSSLEDGASVKAEVEIARSTDMRQSNGELVPAVNVYYYSVCPTFLLCFSMATCGPRFALDSADCAAHPQLPSY